MAMRDDWSKAKTVARKNYDRAVADFTRELERRVKAGEIRARRVDSRLIRAELETAMGRKLAAFPEFRDGLGPLLAAIDRRHDDIERRLSRLRLGDLLRTKKLQPVLAAYAATAGTGVGAACAFLTGGRRERIDLVYDRFIAAKTAPAPLPLSPTLAKKWRDAKEAGTLHSVGKALVKATGDEARKLCGDAPRALARTPAHRRALALIWGLAELEKTADKARRIARAYARTVQGYDRAWRRHPPDFRAPLIRGLDAVLARLGQIESRYA